MLGTRVRHVASAAVAALALGAATAPAARATNDPLIDEQWALTDPAATGVAEAWSQSRGAGVVVAVLDSGVRLSHPDLEKSIWRNPAEVPGNGVDDDRNGYVDDVHGANIKTRNGAVDDDNGHGTHVAGIIAARAGNGIGIAGIAPEAKIMPVKVLDANRPETRRCSHAGSATRSTRARRSSTCRSTATTRASTSTTP